MFFGFEPTIETGLIEYKDGEKLVKKGICKSSAYISDKDEFAIFHFEDDEGNCFKVKGNIKEMKVGNSYTIEGYVRSFNGEKQLSLISYLECKPCTKKAIISYLQTLPGLNAKADLIFDKFGMDSIDILEKHPEQLSQIKGIGQKSIDKWTKEVQKNIGKKYAILELLEYGLTQKQCMKLLKEDNDTSIITRIRNNPYCLIYEVKGFGFLTCDKIAMNMNYSLDSPDRILQGIVYILEQASNEGHVYLPLDDTIKRSKEILKLKLSFDDLNMLASEKKETIIKFGKQYNIDLNYVNFCLYNNDEYVLEEISEEDIKSLAKANNPFVICEDDRIYIRRLYNAECTFATKVVDMCKKKIEVFTRDEVEAILDVICQKDNIELEEKQREAVITFNMYDTGFFILNGSAGTGKTFVAKLILKVNEALNYVYKRKNKITLLPMAPTGKAARVMEKSLNKECITIHRGLQYTENGFLKNHNSPFEENTIFVDETSMLDIELANKLLDAVDINTKLLFIGDTKQLPSVGPGKVLKDLIDSKIPIVVTLNVVKRQGEYSGIIRNATRIILGQDIISEIETDDFYIINEMDNIKIQDLICKQVYAFQKKGYDISDIQVLSPQKPGALGVNMLNYLIQKTINPINVNDYYVKKGEFDYNGTSIAINLHYGDKVINTKNDYSLIWYNKQYGQYIPTKKMGVTNGECGIVDNIRRNENGKMEVVVKYDDYYILYEDLSNLDLAYALTIHKSQGSQWPIVIMPIVNAHSYILSNNLLYTGVTRASEKCYIYGQNNAISRTIRNFKEEVRNTTLKERLIEEFNL